MKNLRSKIFLPFLASFFLGLVLTGTAFGITNSKLNGSLGSGGRVRFNFQISPNSNLVTYRARQDDKNLEELYSVPIAGDEVPIKLSPLVSVPDGGGSVTIRENNISPDGNRVVFKIARTNPNPAPGTSFRENFIYSTPIDGSVEPVRLNVPADPQSFTVLGGVSISRDSNWVVYETSIAPSFGGPLTSIPIDGSKMPITLAEGDDINTGWRISPDNSRVVYASDSELFSIAIDGSSMPVRLTPPRDMGGEKVIFDGITISPDSRRVLYTAYEVSNQSETDIFSVPIDGSAVPVKLNIANGGGVSPDFLITPDGNRVVYRARQGVLSFTRLTPNTLYSAPLDGSTMPVKLTLPFPDSAFEGVTNFQISPDGKRAVYNAINDFQNNTRGFYSVLIDGSAMPVKLSSSFPFAFISDLIISPDSKRVVFNARLDTALIRELYSVPIEGGVPPIILNPPGPSGDDIVFSTQFSSNGSRVIYSAELETDGVRELYSVPIDGSVIPVKLNVPLVTGGDVGDFKVSLDDNYVVYTADQDTDEVTELYSTLLVFDVDIENIIYIISA